MRFIDNQGITDPRINLAIEEYMLNHLDLDDMYLLFYINEPSIIIGRNQNTFEEINVDYVREHNVHVVRRLSGGGAVYHDLGNLNFSFLAKSSEDSFRDFRKFTEPVVSALRKLGVDAELTGRNDIQIGDKKISGNAQFSTKGRIFSHGTLMFDVNLDEVTKTLHVKQDKIESKGIKSIRSRVANIREYLDDKNLTILEFRRILLETIFEGESPIPEYHLTDADWAEIHEISKNRYQNWDWNYGKSPEFNLQHSKRFPIGSIDIRLNVKNGFIESCKIYGDFFGLGEISDVENRITGVKYDKPALEDSLSGINVEHYFGKITLADLIDLIY